MADNYKFNPSRPAQDTPPLYEEGSGITNWKKKSDPGYLWELPAPASNAGRPPAHSQLSTDRRCPRCARNLVMFQYDAKDDIIWVQCKNCLHVYNMENINNTGEQSAHPGGADPLFRLIPLEAVHRWANRIDRGAQIAAKQETGG